MIPFDLMHRNSIDKGIDSSIGKMNMREKIRLYILYDDAFSKRGAIFAGMTLHKGAVLAVEQRVHPCGRLPARPTPGTSQGFATCICFNQHKLTLTSFAWFNKRKLKPLSENESRQR